MFTFKRLALFAFVLLVFCGTAAVSAQADCPAELSVDDCALYQSGIEQLASAQSLDVEFAFQNEFSFGEMLSQNINATGTGQFVLNNNGTIQAAQVIVSEASSESSFMGVSSGSPQTGAAGLIYVDDTFYFGEGSDPENLSWRSVPANGIALSFGAVAPQSVFASVPEYENAWTRDAQNTTLPNGREAVSFSAAVTIDQPLTEALAMLGGTMSGSGGTDSAMMGQLLGLGSDAGMNVSAEYSGAFLVSPEGEPLALGTQTSMQFDMGGMLGLGELMGSSSDSNATIANRFGILIHGLNEELAISAPADATPMPSSQASTINANASSGLLALLTAYYTEQAMAGGMMGGFGGDTTFTFSEGGTDISSVLLLGPITYGETIVEDLETGAIDGYTFDGAAGDAVQINMYADFDTYLELFGPDGTIVASNDDFNGLDSQIGPYVLTQTGEYTIAARAFGNSSEGPYSLTLESVETPAPGAIESGEAVFGSLLSGMQDRWTFSGEAGQNVVIAVSSDDFDTYLELVDPKGSTVASNDDFDGLNSQITYTLEDSGEYTILVYGFSPTASGAYELSLVTATAGAQASTGGNSSDLAYGDSIDAALELGAQDQFTFTGSQGDVITITLDGEFDTVLELLDAENNIVASNDDFNGRNSQIDFVLPADGVYTIIARAFANSGSGNYTLSLLSGAAQPVETTGGDVIRQWASSAEATTQYGSNSWSATQAVGEPNTNGCGDIGTAWASASSTEVASLTVYFSQPVNPTEVNIYQTYNPGSIIRVELIVAGENKPVEVPNSADPVGNTECPGVFTLDLSGVTDGLVEGVIITVDQSIGGNWNEIDAVELVGTP